MKKTLIILGLFLIFGHLQTINAQWIQQSALPTGRSLNSTYFVTPSHGFVVGINHILMETTDSGATWTILMYDLLGTDPFYRIALNGNIGFITGNSTTSQQDILRTIDGGQTWTQVTNFPVGGSWYHIDFVAPGKVYFGSNGACTFTADGGNTYVVKSAYPDCPVMYGMDFRDEQVGLVGGTVLGVDGIYKTTDSAGTWQQKFNSSANDVLWWNDSVALAISGTVIYRSTDAGETWNAFSSGITTGLLELERIDNLALAGVSGKGDVWRSGNGGLTWTQVFDGPGDLPSSWSLHFSDNQHGWVVGQSGFIYSSNDGGITWNQVTNGCGAQVTNLAFLNDNFGMAVGENGYVFKTTNGGNWWDVQKLEVTGQIFGRTESLHGISIVDSNFAVAAGPGGTVFRTLNGGITWQSIGYPNLPDLFWIEDVKFIDANTGWIVGLDQDLGHLKTVYKTTDGGLTWVQAMSDGAYMKAIDFTDVLHGWITTAGNSFRYTTDGGANWITGVYPPYFISPQVSDIDFVNQNVGWVVGWDGFVSHTTDGGLTWTNQNIGTTTDHLFSLQVISSTEAWACGREANIPMNGVVYHTTDGGITWTREISSPNPYWGNAIAATTANVWIAGYEGRIYKKALITGVIENNLSSNQSITVFPNPVSSLTTISFSIEKSQNISILVIDVLGKEIKTISTKNISSGKNKITIDLSELNSGIYFCKIKSNENLLTVKLIKN